MLLLQTDYVVLDIELNERWREMPLNITVQCNGKVKRTTQYISVEKVKDWECSWSMSKCENTGKYYDVDIYWHGAICVLLQTFKDLWYDISIKYNELQKMITTCYLKTKSFPITE